MASAAPLRIHELAPRYQTRGDGAWAGLTADTKNSWTEQRALFSNSRSDWIVKNMYSFCWELLLYSQRTEHLITFRNYFSILAAVDLIFGRVTTPTALHWAGIISFPQSNLNLPFLRALHSSILKGAPALAQSPQVLAEPWTGKVCSRNTGHKGKSWVQPLKSVSECWHITSMVPFNQTL